MKERKHILFLTAVLLGLSACSSGEPQSEESSQQTEEETAEQSASVVWTLEPSIKLDEVYELESYPFILGRTPEYTGSPISWHLADTEEDQYGQVPDYRTDVIAVLKDDQSGIMDYEGNVVFPLIVAKDETFSQEDSHSIRYQPYDGFLCWHEDGSAHVFTADFTRRTFTLTGGIGGWAPEPYVYQHTVLIRDPQSDEAVPYENTSGASLMALVYDDENHACGTAVIGENTEILCEFAGIGDLYANGFVRVRESDDPAMQGKYGFVRVADGKEITGGTVYEDAKYFVEGYAPVKTDGLWAFIDEAGNMVTDPLFTDVSVLCDGKAYVCYEGLYGILDLKQTLAAGIAVNAETCSGTYTETDLVMPEYDENEAIGTVSVNVDNLNSRKLPAEWADKLDKVTKDSTYDVYEIYTDENYTWYRIDESRWIADGGGWVTFTEN